MNTVNRNSASFNPTPRAEAAYDRTTGAVHAALAAASGPVADGVDVDVLAASLDLDAGQFIAQGAMSRVNVSGKATIIPYMPTDLSASAETFSFKANSGYRNPDGSDGMNAGLQAQVVGIEGTATLSGTSLTLGASVGIGLEGSAGTRDADRDGWTEICGRASVGFLTVGACIEVPIRR